MEAKLPNKRPKYLNLFKIRQPLPAVISILHRLTGILLFFPGIPLLLCALQLMLGSQDDYEKLQSFLLNPITKGGLLLLLWFLLHHFFAGIRYLALDLHYGIMLSQARASSKLVLIAGIVVTLLAGLVIW
jgi:succinate dehydrogenase / fumarate reductase cytochrome b subunit